ncbi:MAG: LacI family DNA-binding transcriptional regulator, partial [Paracoccaceae bacterium]
MNLKQLAKKLDLSQTTVSRALNDYPEVSEATRARVKAGAQKHGYSPNIAARNLAMGHAMAIGHVIPVSTQYEIMNPIFSDLIAGASSVYAEHGYELVLSIVDNAEEEEVYRKLKARQSVAGVVLHSPEMSDNRIEFLTNLKLPFAVHGRVSDHTAPYCWVDVNNRSAFRRATELLLDLGHRRIGLINGIETKDFAFRRRQGYEDALAARDVAVDPAIMHSGLMTEEEGYKAVVEMLALPTPPTAFLLSSMVSAFGAKRGIEESGLVLGQDISVVTHD